MFRGPVFSWACRLPARVFPPAHGSPPIVRGPVLNMAMMSEAEVRQIELSEVTFISWIAPFTFAWSRVTEAAPWARIAPNTFRLLVPVNVAPAWTMSAPWIVPPENVQDAPVGTVTEPVTVVFE